MIKVDCEGDGANRVCSSDSSAPSKTSPIATALKDRHNLRFRNLLVAGGEGSKEWRFCV